MRIIHLFTLMLLLIDGAYASSIKVVLPTGTPAATGLPLYGITTTPTSSSNMANATVFAATSSSKVLYFPVISAGAKLTGHRATLVSSNLTQYATFDGVAYALSNVSCVGDSREGELFAQLNYTGTLPFAVSPQINFCLLNNFGNCINGLDGNWPVSFGSVQSQVDEFFTGGTDVRVWGRVYDSNSNLLAETTTVDTEC